MSIFDTPCTLKFLIVNSVHRVWEEKNQGDLEVCVGCEFDRGFKMSLKGEILSPNGGTSWCTLLI